MGVIRNQRSAVHRPHPRHAPQRLYADDTEYGKGVFIGDPKVDPTYDQQRPSGKGLTTTPAADERNRPLRSWGLEGTADSFPFQTYDTNSRVSEGTDDDQYSLKGPASSSIYPDYPDGSRQYSNTPLSAFPHPGHASSLRHNMTSSNTAPASIHHDVAPSSSFHPSPSSSLYPSPSSDSRLNLLELGVNPAASGHLQAFNQALMPDPVSATMEPAFNFSEDCFNLTSRPFLECWAIYENMTDTLGENDTLKALLDIEYKYWNILLIIFPLFTVFGNVLVVMSVFKEKSLKTVTNYFISSLAIADIMVAVAVMPLAVYMEVMTNHWLLSAPLCDAWVASDVLACTASILNLTAISVDRFIAVTQPIKYAKHKNSKRVFVMLAVTWVISVAIAAPITLGVNYSEERTEGDCRFFNSDFIIYSSMGSFYIPSIIMIFLYWKIYKVIRLRALKAKKAKRLRDVDRKALQGVIENPATAAGAALNDTGRATTSRFLAAHGGDEGSVTNVNSNSDDNSNYEDDDESPSGSGSANNITNANDSQSLVRTADARPHRKPRVQIPHRPSGGVPQTCANEAETPFTSLVCKGDSDNAEASQGMLSPKKKTKRDHKKGVTKFNFHMRTSRKRKEKSSSKREKKATKTLAIVLGKLYVLYL
ncbi:D(2) dopamine receptor A-like, partial [Physella acuta]|uniref:D(2) dopamine receptor A-like n=1 Tax=Physella acuta TaxID=109671 RepID=UPI0027DAC455